MHFFQQVNKQTNKQTHKQTNKQTTRCWRKEVRKVNYIYIYNTLINIMRKYNPILAEG